ncbi:hypothetical protein HanRHA438_Chr08g0334681 [Helianthus annuus]|nr:hypothetical protein HanHA89_Chr08g0284141 [Helianthus annuus]KAJ0718039.1 hypothetical protein HanLR1_Chr08g0266241 [Helianthus annuus]KAJ0896438.1 hypothetical protein HanRHA438_Chr08g0334681 [Helianthus annuus]
MWKANLNPRPWGMVGLRLGAWVGGMSLIWPLRVRHVTLLARHMPDFKPKPQGPRRNPRPNPSPRVVA